MKKIICLSFIYCISNIAILNAISIAGTDITHEVESIENLPQLFDSGAIFKEYKINKEKMTTAGFEKWWEQTKNALQKKELRFQGYAGSVDVPEKILGKRIEVRINDKDRKYTVGLLLDKSKYKNIIPKLKAGKFVDCTGTPSSIY